MGVSFWGSTRNGIRFALDFSGSGLSGGEFVSLGFYEREDVEEVIAHLRGSGEVSTIALWGHSMGATTALLYGDRDPSIAAMGKKVKSSPPQTPCIPQ